MVTPVFTFLVSAESYQDIIDARAAGKSKIVVPVVNTSYVPDPTAVDIASLISELGIFAIVQSSDSALGYNLTITFKSDVVTS